MRANMLEMPAPLWTARELVEATGGHWVQEPPSAWLPTGITYMRRLRFLRPGDIYVTMDSRTRAHADGRRDDPDHVWDSVEQLPELAAGGISAIIAQRDIASPPAHLPLLRVADSSRAVLDLAQAARKRFIGRAIVVTGTVGKSTTREMLRHVLSQQGPTVATMANFNTIFAVPLSLAQTPRDTRYAIYELAVSSLYRKTGPISLVVRPHAAIFTALGRGLEGHIDSMEKMADFKARIFHGLEPGGAAIINREMELFERVHDWAQSYGASRIVLFGQHPDAQVRLLEADLQAEHSRIVASVHGERVEYEVPLPGRAMVLNSLGALAAVHAVGGDWRRAAADLVNYETGEGRLRRLRVPIAGGAFELIDDSFNAEQASIIANFEILSLAQPGPGGRRIAVLGQIGGLTNPELTHAELAAPVLKSGVDRVLTLGNDLIHLRRELPAHMLGAHAESAQQLAAAVLAEVRPGDVVSAKGCSITAKFDRVVRHLRTGAASVAGKSAPSRESPGLVGPPPTATAEGNGSPARPIAETTGRHPEIAVRSRYRIDVCFVGDTYFGESYQRQRAKKGKTNFLKEHGYAYSLKYLEGPLNRADLVIANLEAPLVDRTLAPPAAKSRWVHAGKPEATARALLRCNIGAVALANNHSIDYGNIGLAQTASTLDAYGICRFGAGANRTEAARPLRTSAGLRNLSLGLTVFSAFHYVRRYARELKAYAADDRGGVACVSVELLEAISTAKRADPDQFVVVFPHWGENYEWRSAAQVEMADWLFAAGADLIIGHGAHVMQEIERRSDRWVLYSLGNFVFNSDGRHKRSGAPPYSLVARLRLTPDAERIEKALYLYPIVSDNQATLFRPRFVDANEFAAVMQLLTERNADLGASDLVTTGRDREGWYIRLAFDRVGTSR